MFDRFEGNVQPFAVNSTGTERTVFGDTAQSDDINDNLNTDFLTGWETLETGGKPPKQWFNAIHYTLGYLESYLYQEGIAGWDDEQEYYEFGVCKGSDGLLYISQSGTDGSPNVGNDPTTDDGTNWLSFGKTGLIDNITVTVGGAGDFASINDALEYLVKTYYPIYDSAGVTATINLLTGFTMAEQVLVRGLNLGWITITGDDAETTIDHTALTTNFTGSDYGFNSFPAFGASKGGTLPRIGQMFRFSATGVGGNKHGVMTIGAGSKSEILTSCGVADAGTYGLYVYGGGIAFADGADFSDANMIGVYALSSTIHIANGDVSGAGTDGVYATRGATVDAAGINASSCGDVGIHAERASTIEASAADVSGATTIGVHAERASKISALGIDASGAGSYGVVSEDGANIDFSSGDATTAGVTGIRVVDGSIINADSATGTLSQAVNTVTANGIIFQ